MQTLQNQKLVAKIYKYKFRFHLLFPKPFIRSTLYNPIRDFSHLLFIYFQAKLEVFRFDWRENPSGEAVGAANEKDAKVGAGSGAGLKAGASSRRSRQEWL